VVAGHRIDTDRLMLRCPFREDAAEICRLLADREVAYWLVRVPYPYRVEDAEAWIERSAEERAAGIGWPFLVTLRETGMLIGSMDLSVESTPGVGTLGYWLGAAYWGCGYATEALRAIVEFGFETAQLKRVTAGALPDNLRSRRVLEKAGLRFTGRRKEATADRGDIDIDYFTLDRADRRC
jgi:8-oxo-dGTP diphosphatase